MTSIEPGYQEFAGFCRDVTSNSELFLEFKSNPIFRNMLEHVTLELGKSYYTLLKSKFNFQDAEMLEFCKVNDMYGRPELFTFSNSLTCSPSSLRYLFQSSLILSHIQSLNMKSASIVEVGCGYGGLFLAINFLRKRFNVSIDSYSLVDLPPCSRLQSVYLNNFQIETPHSFHLAHYYGSTVKGDNLYFISNYAFSEISLENQSLYIQTLLDRCNHGFLTWNSIDLYNFGKEYRAEVEYPLTGPKNKYVSF